MSSNSPSRRSFIGCLALGFVAASCKSENENEKKEPGPGRERTVHLSLEESIAVILAAVGPWSVSETAEADEFVERFLGGEARMETLRKHTAGVISLAGRLADRLAQAGAKRLDAIPISQLSDAERDALHVTLVELYSIQEIRFRVGGEPRAGVCMPDLGFLGQVPT